MAIFLDLPVIQFTSFSVDQAQNQLKHHIS